MIEVGLKTVQDGLNLSARRYRVTIYNFGVAGKCVSIAGDKSMGRRIQPQITAPLAAGGGIMPTTMADGMPQKGGIYTP